MPWSAFLGYFPHVIDRISFIFDPNIKVKKTKFAQFSALSFCNWTKSSGSTHLKAKIIQMCHGLLSWDFLLSVLDRISFIFDPNIKDKKIKIAEFSGLAFCNWAKLSNFSRLEARIIQMCHGLLL